MDKTTERKRKLEGEADTRGTFSLTGCQGHADKMNLFCKIAAFFWFAKRWSPLRIEWNSPKTIWKMSKTYAKRKKACKLAKMISGGCREVME